MARRRRGAAPEGEAPADTTPVIEGPGPQATLTVRGSAESVKKQLGIGSESKSAEPVKPKDGNGHDSEREKFVEALRNPRYLVRIKRQSPRNLAGHCWDAECPIAYTKIQDETREGWGGGTFRAAVVDQESNKTIAADHFDIPGEPMEPEGDVLSEEEQRKLFMSGGNKSASEMTVEGLNRRAEVTAKMLEVESLEAQLEDARKRREGGKQPPQDNSRYDDLERRLMEAKHQAEIEARDRKHENEMRELKALIAQNSRPQKEEGGESKMMTMLLEQMREDRKASDARFNAMMAQMQDNKMTALMEEVRAIKNRPVTQSQSLLDQAEAILKLKKVFGWGGDDGDDDEGDDENDDRPWWEKALDKLGGKLGDKLFEKFTNMEEKGEKVDRAKFLAETAQYADQIAAEAVERARRAALPAPAPKLPAPPPPAPAGAKPSIPPPPPQATSLPPPPPPAAPEVPAAAPAPAPEPAQARLTVEQEIVLRVGGVLEMVDREMELRPNEYVWNYEGAFNSLPESVLEKVCAAADPVAMIDAFAIPGINPEGIAAVKAKVSANPRMLAWLKMGHDELKLWWAEKLKDPRYDPFAEEEGEEE